MPPHTRVPMTSVESDGPRSRRLAGRGATLAVVWALAATFVLPACSNFTVTPAPTAAVGSLPPTLTETPTTDASPTGSTATTRTQAPAGGAPRPAPSRIRIPAIGVNSTLVRLGLNADGTLAVPTKAMTAGWYTGSPIPGDVGPAIIAGHVHWSGIPAVFAHLADLTRGDRIVVTRTDGTATTFIVSRVASYPKTRFPTTLVYGNLEYPGLRLITCGGFDRAAHAYEANIVVFASRTTT